MSNPTASLYGEGLWEKDVFPGFVETVLDSLAQPLSRSVRATKRMVPEARITKKEWLYVRKSGIYFPPGDQLFLDSQSIDPTRLVQHASLALLHENPEEKDWGEYCSIMYLTRMPFPPSVRATTPGTHYRLIVVQLKPNGKFVPAKGWLTISKTGQISTSEFDIDEWFPVGSRNGPTGGTVTSRTVSSGMEPVKTSITWSAHIDKDRLWLVQAEGQREASATFGVRVEQIKSLFYARDLPLTAAGRRRPILHWVDAHNRRLKNGTDVVIPAHLKGIEQFTMGDTIFRICSPSKPERVYRDPGPSPEKRTRAPDAESMMRNITFRALGRLRRARLWLTKFFGRK